ncbi:hypothetical protein ONS95_014498 [Cadophora gregata]|uniref:uncharacterized protein n=1 Tax=Cadophora gregata TaxID=51156 RepID=UPI0026DBE5B9|nr:uncharacterized protein ONS95_014498 [Cadophora gregata]KAK0112764.1 hypothetical protein ONS95_014498 [Cadophora gregata]KAK0124896.1 hypothetical protein ONS96_008774 [Cadophora gregata f. sp. sojae]
MCQFQYQIFKQCSHGVVNVAEYCRMQQWMAGIKRQLRPCFETTYNISKYMYQGPQWQVISGPCANCVLQRPATTQASTLRSIATVGNLTAQLAAVGSYGEATGEYRPMRPPNTLELLKKDSMSPIPHERPFVSLPGITTTLPELLGFNDKLYDKTAALFDKIVFPPRFIPYVDQTESSWTIKALGVARPLELYFIENGGLLVMDRESIRIQLSWKDEQAIWKTDFEPRGMPLGEFEAQCRKGEHSFPGDSDAASICAKFYQLHAESAAAQRRRDLEDSRKIEGLRPLSELSNALGLNVGPGEAVAAKDRNDSEPQLGPDPGDVGVRKDKNNAAGSQNHLGSQVKDSREASFGSPSGNLDAINKAGPPPRPWIPNSSVSLTNNFGASDKNIGIVGGHDASNAGSTIGQTSNLDPPPVSRFPQGLPRNQNFRHTEQAIASNIGYTTGQTKNFDPLAFPSVPTGLSRGQNLGSMGQVTLSNRATVQNKSSGSSNISRGPPRRFVPILPYPSSKGQMDDKCQSGSSPSMFSSVPQGQFNSPAAFPSIKGQTGAIHNGGTGPTPFSSVPQGQSIHFPTNVFVKGQMTGVNQTGFAPISQGQFMPPVTNPSVEGQNQSGLGLTYQTLPLVPGGGLLVKPTMSRAKTTSASAFEPTSQVLAPKQSTFIQETQQFVAMSNANGYRKTPVPTTQMAAGSIVHPVGHFNAAIQGGVYSKTQQRLDMLSANSHSDGPVSGAHKAPGPTVQFQAPVQDGADPVDQPPFELTNERLRPHQESNSTIAVAPVLAPDPAEEFSNFAQSGVHFEDQQLFDALNVYVSSQEPVSTVQATSRSTHDPAGQLDGIDGIALGNVDSGNRHTPNLLDGQISAQKSVPLSQAEFARAGNSFEPSGPIGGGEIDSGNRDLDAILFGRISEQAPTFRPQTPFGAVTNSAGQLESLGYQSFTLAAGDDILDQSALSPPGGKSISQPERAGYVNILNRAEDSPGKGINLDQPLSGTLDEDPLGFDQNLPEQRRTATGEMQEVSHGGDQQMPNAGENHLGLGGQASQVFPNSLEWQDAPTGEMEGIIYGKVQKTLAEAIGTSSGPDQEPNVSASMFGAEDVFRDGYNDFDQDTPEERNEVNEGEEIPNAADFELQSHRGWAEQAIDPQILTKNGNEE